jgi:alpha-1,3-rhamnosyltransferase
VIVASYNHARFIEATVASVLGQTVADLELVVVDDGSTDDSLDRLRALEAGDDRLRVLTHPNGENRGRQASFRLAVEASSAPLIGILGSDDRWLPDKLEHQLPVMRGGCVLSYGRAALIDEDGRPLGRTIGQPLRGPATEVLLRHNLVPALTALFRRDAHDAVGGFSVDQTWEDLDLWLRLTTRGDAVWVDHVLGEYRVIERSVFHELQAAGRDLHASLDAVDHFATWPGLPAALEGPASSWQRCHGAIVALIDGQPDAGLKALEAGDAPRLSLLVGDHFSRLRRTVGDAALVAWSRSLGDLGEPFPSTVGARLERLRRRGLKGDVRAAARERDAVGLARSTTRLALDRVSSLRTRRSRP